MNLKDIKIGRRILLVFTIIFILNVLLLAYNRFSLIRIESKINSMYDNLNGIDLLIEADRDAYQSSIAISQALNPGINSDSKKLDKMIASMNENIGQVKTRFGKFRNIHLQGGGEKYREFDIFNSEYEKLMNHTVSIEQMFEKSDFNSIEKLYYGDYQGSFDILRDSMDKLTVKTLSDAENNYKLSFRETDNILMASSLMNLVIILLLVFSGFLLSRSITRPLNNAVKLAEKIANGDLTATIDVHSKDETGQLSKSMKIMTEKLSEVIRKVNNSSQTLASASGEITSTAQSLSEGANEQAANVQEMSASLEEMGSTINQNAENSRNTDEIAQKTASQAEEGGEAVLQTVDAMKKITEKITMIEDIAYQTNLLALNAAIEAARAGEHGKGFAVVAGEVRKLAEKSQGASKEIGELANSSTGISERAVNLLNEMVPNIKKTADLIQDISSASEQQDSGVNQINTGMEQLNQLTQQNASASQELASTSTVLNTHARELKEMMDFFKLDDSESDKKLIE